MGLPLSRGRRRHCRRAGDRIREAVAVSAVDVPLATARNRTAAPPVVRSRPQECRRQTDSLFDPCDQCIQERDGRRAGMDHRDGVAVPTKKKKSPPRMPKWKPAPQDWIEAFDSALPSGVERRKMFGYPAAFVNGNMAAGLHQDDLVLKLEEKDRAALMKAGGKPFVVMGRTMGAF